MVVVLGDPAYYGRFGFVSAGRHRVEPPAGIPTESFMVMCFASHDDSAQGQVIYADVFRETGTL
jgi:putative acetyltransferase